MVSINTPIQILSPWLALNYLHCACVLHQCESVSTFVAASGFSASRKHGGRAKLIYIKKKKKYIKTNYINRHCARGEENKL